MKRLSWRIRLAYGIGQLAEGVKSSAFSFFLLFYYVSVLGISGTAAGLAIFISLCFDGITDPLMGSISDASKSKRGRRHPFIYGAIIPFVVSFYFLFNPPSGLCEAEIFAWLVVFAILTRGFMTIYAVPHLSLNAELSDDYGERTTLASIRSMFSLMGYLIVVVGGFFYFFADTPEFSNGQMNPSAYSDFALTFAVIMAVVIFLSAWGTRSSRRIAPVGVRPCDWRGYQCPETGNRATGDRRRFCVFSGYGHHVGADHICLYLLLGSGQ
jgi:GPH family glycoside/pentoside/hexuronide:cation symporter